MTLNYNELRREFKNKQRDLDRQKLLTKKTDKELSELRIKHATAGNWNGIYSNQK